jgi:hypothetical protein
MVITKGYEVVVVVVVISDSVQCGNCCVTALQQICICSK